MGKIDKKSIFDIHKLHDEGNSQENIAKKLGICRESVSKYLKNPNKTFEKRKPRESKLDNYCELIDDHRFSCLII